MSSALEQHRARFTADPGEVPSFEALEEHEFLSGEWQNLVALYRHRLTAPDVASTPRARVEILFRLGQTLEERCQRPEEALACYREAAQINPRYTPVLRQLRRLYAAREQWELVLQFAEMEAETLTRPRERATLDAEMASVWQSQLDDPSHALALYDRCLAAEPDHARALFGRAEVLEVLDRATDATQAWSQVVSASRGRERAVALLRMARLHQGPLKQPERAIELFRRALTDDPENEEALGALAAVATQREQWPLLADLGQRRFELAAGAERRAEIAAELGWLHLERLDDLPGARSWFARALELRPDDIELHRGMADVARRADDRDALVQSLDRIAELSGNAASPEMLLEVASLHTEHEDDEAALAKLRRALAGAPESLEVLDGLAAALRRTGGHEELVDVLERRLALPEANAELRVRLLAELGAIHEQQLQDLDAACEAYERAFAASPSTPGVASALERIYRKSEQWEDLHQFLMNALRVVEGAERVHLLSALGDLLGERFDDTQGAISRYEEALALDPGAEPALRGLRSIAERSGDPDAILHAVARQARAARDPDQLAEVVPELVSRLEERGDLEEALGWSERLHDARPEDPRPLEDCARLHEKLGHTDEQIATLERLDGLLSGSARATHRRRVAELYLELNRESEAISAFQAALEADPRDREALVGIVAPLERARRFAELASVKRRLVELLPEPQRRACEWELADILSEKLGDLDDAIVVLWRLADEHADDEIDERLDSLLERAGRFEELAQHLLERGRRGSVDDGARVELDLRRATLLLQPLGRFEEAIRLYRDIRAADPSSTAALDGLENALRAARDSAGLVDLLAERSAADVDPALRAKFDLERASLLHEELGRTAEARELYASLADGDVDVEVAAEARGRLVRLLEQEMDYPALFDCLRAGLGRGSRAEDAALHQRLAELARDRLQDPDRAIAHLEAATELGARKPELWEALSSLYEAQQRSSDALRTLEAALALELEADRELRLRVRAARLCAGALDQPERAFTHYSRARELDPGHADAIDFLAARAESDGRWRELAGLLEARLEALVAASQPADVESRNGVRIRLASLYSGPLEDLEAARGALEAALDELGLEARITEPLADLYYRLGRREDLLRLCKRAIQETHEPAERADWHRRAGDALAARGEDDAAAKAYARALADRPGDRAAEEALRSIHRRRGEAAPLARLLELELSRVAGSSEIPLRLELATLLAGPLKRPEDAIVQLRRVLQIDAGCQDALHRALELSEALGRHDETFALLDVRLGRARSAGERATLLARQAALLAGPLERPEDAIPLFREALALEPQQQALRHSLRALLERLERWPAVLDCLHVEAMTAEPERRAELLEEATEIAANRISHDASLPWLVRLRAERPDDAGVVARIADIHRRAGRPEALLRALEDEIALAPDRTQRWGLHLERARILEVDLQSPARALAVLREARAEAPRDVAVLRELDRLYAAAGRPAERFEVLEALLDRVSGAERVALHRTLAELLAGPLSEPARAAEHLKAALEQSSETGLPRIAMLQMLGSALLRAERLDAWAQTAEEELSELDPDVEAFAERRRELHRKLAWARLGPLADPDAALLHLRDFVDSALASGDASAAGFPEAEAALFQLLRREDMHAELGRRLALRLEREPDDPDGWLELARLREEKLHLKVSAAHAYREAVARRPDDLPALRGLRRCSERIGDWSEVAACLERELELTENEPAEARAALLRGLADVAFHRLQSTTRASRALAAALEADPRDLASLRALETLFEAMEDWRGALELYQSEIDVLGEAERDRRQRVWLRIGELARDRTDDAQRAIRAYEAACAIGELPPPRYAEMAELYRRVGDLPRYVETLTHYCDAPRAAAGSESHMALARALEDLERPREALARFEEALRVDRRGRAAWEAVARLRETLGDAAGAAEALAEAAGLLSDAEAVARLLRAAGLIEGDDPSGAAELAERAVERDPGSSAAHAARARLCARLERFAEVLESAQRVLELERVDATLDPEQTLETAIFGGTAARALDRPDLAVHFYAHALSDEQPRPDVMAAHAEALFELGDWHGARRALEARLEMPGENPDAARQLLLLGTALESLGNPEAALERYCEAVERDASLQDAHAGRVRLYEASERLEDAIAALESWANHASDAEQRAAHLTRAAEFELCRSARGEAAEDLLRQATGAEPSRSKAWILLAEHLSQTDRPEEAADAARDGLASVDEPAARAQLCRILGRALEACSKPREAAAAYAEALESGDLDAALARARILRTLGDWTAAAETLCGYAERPESAHEEGIARVYLQLGRLRAGPLEEIEPAIDAYRRALEADPKLREAHEALADLLSHRPDAWSEALVRHREILSENPLRQASLRGVMRIAERRENADAVRTGQAILRALGLSTPQERADAPAALELRIATDGGFEHPIWERIRRVSLQTADEIATALSATHAPPATEATDPTARFRSAALEAEGQLAAPALIPLSTEEVGTLLRMAAQLALEPDEVSGDGDLVNALSSALRRRTRRRVRKLLDGVSSEEIAAIDFAAWRDELRTMANAVGLDAIGGDLRAALLALTSDGALSERRAVDPDADLSASIGDHRAARALLARVALAWIDTIR